MEEVQLGKPPQGLADVRRAGTGAQGLLLDEGNALVATTADPSWLFRVPAEMGGSIHIHGTGSSIVDTVFVCRDLTEHQVAMPFDQLEGLIRELLSQLEAAGIKPTPGDIRCRCIFPGDIPKRRG